MERTFVTHEVRKSREISGLWKFFCNNNSETIRQVSVPSCWETYPGLENYRGAGTYEKVLYLKGNTRFSFKGVSHTADVYLDEEKIAHHYNAYTPFDVVIEGIKEGLHTLRVIADNSFHEESALHVGNDYFSYGGISRPVIVEELEAVWIRKMTFRPYQQEGEWHGELNIYINNLGKECDAQIQVTLKDSIYINTSYSISAGETVINQDLTFTDASSYELDDPQLYMLQTILMIDGEPVDDLIDRVGFRELIVEDKNVLWNGNPIAIKGFNRHEDHALFGCAIPYEAMVNDLQLLQDMGANAVRTSHYPNDERFLDLCDEYGILVWEEAHARGLSEEQMRHKNFRKQSLDCIDEMIHSHYNHPTIFTWGILNECASYTEYGRIVYEEQFERIKKWDTSRPLTFASCHFKSDICLDLPDIVSMNIYPLWYHDSPAKDYVQEVYDWVQETEGRGKPYIVSEIGAGAIPGFRSPARQKWSEERQADILKEQLEAVLSHKGTMGVFIWQFCDGRVPDENFYARPRCMNNKGIVDEYRRRKMSYDVVKAVFNQ